MYLWNSFQEKNKIHFSKKGRVFLNILRVKNNSSRPKITKTIKNKKSYVTKKKIENRSHAEDELTLSSIREATGLICASLNSWAGTQEAFNKHLAEWFDERRDEWDMQMTEGKRTEVV